MLYITFLSYNYLKMEMWQLQPILLYIYIYIYIYKRMHPNIPLATKQGIKSKAVNGWMVLKFLSNNLGFSKWFLNWTPFDFKETNIKIVNSFFHMQQTWQGFNIYIYIYWLLIAKYKYQDKLCEHQDVKSYSSRRISPKRSFPT
jgi:hypothetical protein